MRAAGWFATASMLNPLKRTMRMSYVHHISWPLTRQINQLHATLIGAIILFRANKIYFSCQKTFRSRSLTLLPMPSR
jgi:hypothetical protein